MAKVFDHKIIILVFLLWGCGQSAPTAEVLHVNASVTADSSLYTTIEPYQKSMSAKMDKVIGYAEQSLVKAQPEGALGNFITDLTLYTAFQFGFMDLPEGETFCLLNHGGLRAPISEGEITVGNIYEVMPFDNEIVVVQLSGQKVFELANYVVQYGGHPMSGIEIVAEKKNDIYEIEVFIHDQLLDLEKEYYVVTSDYLANGGDHMNFFKEPIALTRSGVLLRDAIIAYIEKLDSSVSSKVEGRLKIKDHE